MQADRPAAMMRKQQVHMPSRLRIPGNFLSGADTPPQAEVTLDAAQPRTRPPAVPGLA